MVAYLAALDITGFNSKSPPPKTEAFRAIVDAGRAPEDAELMDVLEKLNTPPVVTLSMLASRAEGSFEYWLEDRKSARAVSHRLEACGYQRVSNPNAKDGMWKVSGRRVIIYGRSDLSVHDRVVGAQAFATKPPQFSTRDFRDLSMA